MARRKVSFEIKRNPKIFEDRQHGFENLISCIFHDLRQIHLIDKAVFFLNIVKRNSGWNEDDYKKYVSERYANGAVKTLTINGKEYSYSNYETILQTLRSVGMLRKTRGVYRLSGDFSSYLLSAQQAWISFLTST